MAEEKWQPIDTAPKDGTVVDLWVVVTFLKGDDVRASRYPDCQWERGRWFDPYGGPSYDHTGEYLVDDEHQTTRITHWMPAPAGPVEEK